MIATTNHHRYPNLSRGLLLSFPFLVLLSNSILPASAFAPYYRGSSRKAVASTRLYAAPKKSSKKSKTSSSSKKTSTTTTTQKKSTNSAAPAPAASTPLARAEGPKTSSKPRQNIDISSLGDLTGGRPGAIIETEEELARKKEIFEELDERGYDKKTMKDYGELQEELEAEYDIDDPEAIDAATLGTWTIKDLQSRFTYEWDPEDGDPDPNELEMNQEGVRYKEGVDIDEEGIEIGYNPMFGPSSPMDERTILGAMDSYMIDEKTRDDSMLPPTFPEGDLEIGFNQDVVNFRKSLDIIETFTDTFYKDMEVPRHVAKWHGYPEPMSYPPQDEKNNRFLDENATDFSKLDPYQARRKAIELARAQNADWLPPGKSHAYHEAQRAPYEKVGTLVGSLRPGKVDEALKEKIMPALNILGSCAELLSIEGEDQTVFRFHYHGLMKNRHGMAAWTETLIRDCGVEVTGVVFETGFRRRDVAYDGGDCWYPPSS